MWIHVYNTYYSVLTLNLACLSPCTHSLVPIYPLVHTHSYLSIPLYTLTRARLSPCTHSLVPVYPLVHTHSCPSIPLYTLTRARLSPCTHSLVPVYPLVHTHSCPSIPLYTLTRARLSPCTHSLVPVYPLVVREELQTDLFEVLIPLLHFLHVGREVAVHEAHRGLVEFHSHGHASFIPLK